MDSIAERQRRENEYWKNSKTESPESNAIENIVNKVSEAAVFLNALKAYRSEIPSTGVILEIGCGQGWASCLMKRMYPQARIIATDLSKYAVASCWKWEKLWGAKIDDCYACRSYETREGDESVDLVFCFASAHHFAAHRKTLQEMHRILRPGGKCLYLHEPTSPTLWYPLAYKRVNLKRPEAPEDVLVVSTIERLARECRLEMCCDYFPSLLNRGPLETIYYYTLSRIKVLSCLLPCTANLIFSKVC